MSTADITEEFEAKTKRYPLVVTIVIVCALFVLFLFVSGFIADVLWFDQLGYVDVLYTRWLAIVGLFFTAGLSTAIPVFLAIFLSYRRRPVYVKLNTQLDRYQEMFDPIRKLALFGIPLALGFFAAAPVAMQWEVVQAWLHRTAGNSSDPQFDLNVSFYLFELPFYQSLTAFVSAMLLLCLLATIVTSYLYGGIALVGRNLRVSKSMRLQMAILAGLYVLSIAAKYWLDQYATLAEKSALITGAGYTEVNATIPAKVIMAGIAVLVAVLFVVAAVTGKWRLPIVGTALLLVSSLVIGSVYPLAVQRLKVKPSEKSLEEPYIQRNIDATRDAYGLTDVVVEPYDAVTTAEPGALKNDALTTASIRIIDPAVVSPTVRQLEQIKPYYQFQERLDVDRYLIDGEVQDAVIGVRELNAANQKGWYNQTLVYTHGYGLVASYGNQRSADGLPVFLESGIPTDGALGTFEPRVYFGEQSPLYSIVGGKGADGDIELDYPAGEDGANQTRTTFAGDGGPKLDNLFKRLVYAMKFQSEQIVLSEAVTNDSQILYDRSPLRRVQKVAPYLTLDSDPYASVVDGRLVWIIDGYTTSANYPYSTVQSLGELIADSETRATGLGFDDINYIRNSVKATVDAYDGSVTLYQWDDTDPILKTWMKVFPNTVKPSSEMSGDLLSHVRYPVDLFKVQRAMLGQYHVTDAGPFYSQEDAWRTPNDPVLKTTADVLQPPYYLTLSPGTDEEPTYSIYSTYIPLAAGTTARSVLTGYLTANSNAGSTKGTIAEDYGTLKLLTLPKGNTIPGPGQVQNNFTTDNQVSTVLNILSNGGQTEVINGNLLTLPVGGGLLYVQPVYVKSQAETSYPVLQKVLVAFGDKIAFEDTLDEALDVLFGGDSGATAGDTSLSTDRTPDSASGQPGAGQSTPQPTPKPSATPQAPAPDGGDPLQTALRDMQQAIADRDAARVRGDWAAYGEAETKLNDALKRALEAAN